MSVPCNNDVSFINIAKKKGEQKNCRKRPEEGDVTYKKIKIILCYFHEIRN